MPFLLSRGGPNVAVEVQRWQYFLRRQSFAQAGRVDGQFGLKTETATQFFQVQHGLEPSGHVDLATVRAAEGLGYTILPDDHYATLAVRSFPPKPKELASPTNSSRNAALGCFEFRQAPLAQRADKDEIEILGDCAHAISDWRRAEIVTIAIDLPIFAVGFTGEITCHRKAADPIRALFDLWRQRDLLHLVITFDGAFSPRYKRNKSPSDEGHGVRRSRDVGAISNHAFGAAFDVNEPDNPFGGAPAAIGRRGCVRELVASANEAGFYWGGHFSDPVDGMHFELTRF